MTASKPWWVPSTASRICSTSHSSLTKRSVERKAASCSSASRWRSTRVSASALLRPGRSGAGPVDAGSDLGVGVAHDADRDLAGVLADGLTELVDVAGRETELGLDVGEGGAGTDPELAVARVAEELLGVAVGERAEVEDGLVPVGAARRRVAGGPQRLEHEHGVGLAVAAEAREVGEGAVRAEDVVAVVAAHLEAAGRDDEALTGEGGADGVAATGCVVGDLAPEGSPRCRAGAQPVATKARNSSVVGRLRLGEVFCSSLITRPWCHEATGAAEPGFDGRARHPGGVPPGPSRWHTVWGWPAPTEPPGRPPPTGACPR